MIELNYISSVIAQFTQYRIMAERAIEQVPDDKISWQYNPEVNSIAILVKHMAGNMRSRFTDFYTSDGEKKWRDRDSEFENETLSRSELMEQWTKGWNSLFDVLNSLQPEDLLKHVMIRNEPHTVMEAINRQLTHYAGHVGQIIFLSKMICDSRWNTLTIPRKGSQAFNASKGI